MYKDRVQKALEIAAAPTLEDMRRERKRLPRKLAKLMTYLVNHLFDFKLTATRAWGKAGIRDHSLSAAFRDATQLSLRQYIERRRLEIADRMMRGDSGVELTRISEAVGYEYHGTFVRAYKKWLHETPSEARKKPAPPEIDYLQWRSYVSGELEEDAAWATHQIGLRIYPSFDERLRQHYGQTPSLPRLEIGGPRQDRWAAEGFWQELRGLPFERQKFLLRGVRFHSTALFDLLREKSREEGRRNRRRGVELAELALLSLEDSEDVFGSRVHDLRALGWAWLGNAQVLAHDFSAAEAAFLKADDAWGVPREREDQLALAAICRLKGYLRMIQRRYEEALPLVDFACSMFQLRADAHGEVRALIQRAAILGYSGSLEDSIVALEQAQGILKQTPEPYLAFAVTGNLANSLARHGLFQQSREHLVRASDHLAQLDFPLGRHQLQWIDGDIKLGSGDAQAAEEFYSAARSGFGEAKEWNNFVLTSLDLAILYSEKSEWTSVLELASTALPILQSLRLYPETIAAVDLLAKAVSEGSIPSNVLRALRERLHQDPLITLS